MDALTNLFEIVARYWMVEPVCFLRLRHRPRVELLAGGEARPWVVGCALHDSGADRILQYVADQGEEVLVALHREVLESTLPDMAAAAMCEVVSSRVPPEQSVNEPAQRVDVIWLNDCVKMVRHDRELVDPSWHTRLRFPESVDESTEVGFVVENCSSIIAAVQDVVDLAA
jgi:hypothetical protein